MDLVVRAFPVLSGKEVDVEEFARDVSSRQAELDDFYRRYGVVRETWHVQRTEHGLWIIGVTQLEGRPAAEVAPEYAASQREFDVWFKGRVRELSGVDPDVEPLGPPTRCLFDWSAS